MKVQENRKWNPLAVLAMTFASLGVVWAAGRTAQDSPQNEDATKKLIQNVGKTPSQTKSGTANLVIAGGCFWCIEAQLEMLKGVKEVESGYAGGNSNKSTYYEVSGGKTGHAEVVKVSFDPKVISEADLLRVFFVSHDPTQLNRQGGDYGTQYRSAIFYANEAERKLAISIKAEITKAKLYESPIVTTIEPLKNYIKAEDYHQDYFAKFAKATPAEQEKMNGGYCSYVVSPKVTKFRKQFKHLLK